MLRVLPRELLLSERLALLLANPVFVVQEVEEDGLFLLGLGKLLQDRVEVGRSPPSNG